jgi:hypothetical protein
MWIVKQNVGVFSAIRIGNEKCKCRLIGKKDNKNQPKGDKKKTFFRMWNVVLRMCIAIYYPHHDRSGIFEWLWY